MAEKKKLRIPEGHDEVIDELFSVIEDGKVFIVFIIKKKLNFY